MGCIAIQLLCPRHGQAERASARGAGRAAREQARGTGAGGCAGRAGESAGHADGSAGHADGRVGVRGRGAWHRHWACCWAVGCALGALSLFLTRFDSVLFLSQFLDIVRELGS